MSQDRHEQLSRMVIKGFKSIKDCDIELNHINVFIGSNGAGKSNFISAFELLQNILEGNLLSFAAKKGASTIFYNGIKVTEHIKLEVHSADKKYKGGVSKYSKIRNEFNICGAGPQRAA